jgi:large subunit ribosomal protein L6
MSRIGKKAVAVPSGVKVELSGESLKISSGSETLVHAIKPVVKVEYDSTANEIKVTRESNERFARAMHGTTRSLIANMIQGVTQGYEKGILMYGTGYGVKEQGAELHLSVGTAKPAQVPIPRGVVVDIKTPNARGNDVPAEISIKGADKQTVGQFAAVLRRVRPPEPYNGKGVRYRGEVIKKKAGKAFASGGA